MSKQKDGTETRADDQETERGGRENRERGGAGFVTCMLNVPATCKVNLRNRSAQTMSVPLHQLRSCRSDLLSHQVTAC